MGGDSLARVHVSIPNCKTGLVWSFAGYLACKVRGGKSSRYTDGDGGDSLFTSISQINTELTHPINS